MITKTVIKDYVLKRCPYLTSMELNDRTLVQLLQQSIDNQEEYEELISEELDEEGGSEKESMFNLVEIFHDYPQLKEQLQKYANSKPKNKAEKLIDNEEYNNSQIVHELSRKYFENIYGKENCARCDINDDGKELLNQQAIIDLTNKYMKDKSIKVIFEGQLEYNEFWARFDVLIRDDKDPDAFELVEVKGTNTVFITKKDDPYVDTKIKDNYLYDMLFQYYVYSNAGIKLTSLSYLYSNKEFKLKTQAYPIPDNELSQFFIKKNYIDLENQPRMSLIQYFDSELYVPKKVEEDERDNYTIEGIIYSVRQIAKLAKTTPEKCYLCVKGPRCPFLKMCFKESDDPNSIFKLTRWNLYGGYYGRTKDMLEEGITEISNITPEYLDKFPEITKNGRRSNARTQIEYAKGNIKEKYVLDMNRLKEILKKDYMNDDIDYLLFFDFESFMYPIPIVENSSAWQQVVSQYSMHIVDKGYDLSKHDFAKGEGGGITHREYIANPDDTKYANPSIPLYRTLWNQLVEHGIDPFAKNYKVVVFNRNFEQSRLKDFKDDFTGLVEEELVRFVMNFRENVVDLLDFFTSGAMYCRDFNGRGSLKVVQPTLADDEDVQAFYKKELPYDLDYTLDYHKKDENDVDKCLVYNGGICLDLYKSLVVRSHLGGSRVGEPSTDELLAEALAYCKIDSWGTVIIYDIIKNVCLEKLKLDATFR